MFKQTSTKPTTMPTTMPASKMRRRPAVVSRSAVAVAPGPLLVAAIDNMPLLPTIAMQTQSEATERKQHARYQSIHQADLVPVGSIESWRLLLKELSMLVGNQGSAAILFQCIGKLGPQYPVFAALSPQHSWPEQLAIVQSILQQLPQAAATLARQSLWWRGCQLLTKLFGQALSRRLQQKALLAPNSVLSAYQHG